MSQVMDFHRAHHAPTGQQFVFMVFGVDGAVIVRVSTTSVDGSLEEKTLPGFDGMTRNQALLHIEDNAEALLS